jgi:hypothetical protein
MSAKKLLEETPVWAKVDDNNLSKKVLIEFAEEYADQQNKDLLKEVEDLKGLIQVSEDKYREVITEKALKSEEITNLKKQLEESKKDLFTISRKNNECSEKWWEQQKEITNLKKQLLNT